METTKSEFYLPRGVVLLSLAEILTVGEQLQVPGDVESADVFALDRDDVVNDEAGRSAGRSDIEPNCVFEN